MFCESLNKKSAIKPLIDNRVEQYHNVAHLIIYREVDDLEIILAVEYVQVLDNFIISDVTLAERCSLIEYRECIAHTSISLFCNHGQCLLFESDTLLLGHMLKVVDGVANSHTLKVVYLATAQDGGQDFMLFGCGQNENHMCGWLLKCFKECIECSSRQHVNLVDDKYLVFAKLRRDTGLFHQCLDVLNRVV